MHEIVPGLWVGDLVSALDGATLKKHGIGSVLTVMRGRFSIGDVCPIIYCVNLPDESFQTFIKHQVQLDDSQDADILMHFLPCIRFIQKELGKGQGVLVHCHAGISAYPFYPSALRSHKLKVAALQLSQPILCIPNTPMCRMRWTLFGNSAYI